jgi:uncharacterized membrane protein YdbT with pleckstrin-like domain
MSDTILYQSHPSMFKNNPLGFILSILLIPLGIGVIILLIWWLRVKGTALIVSDERVTLRTGILSKHTNEIYHTDIRNVQVSQGVFQRMFGVGTIGVSSSGQGGVEIAVAGIPTPQKIKDLIDKYRRQKN